MADIHTPREKCTDTVIVPDNVLFTSEALWSGARRLKLRYPFLGLSSAGRSVMGRELLTLQIGTGPREVFYNASHHANEWITSLLLMRFIEEFLRAAVSGGDIGGKRAQALYESTTLTVLPMVNPDGVDLVNGAHVPDASFDNVRLLAGASPRVPFPSGWKANIRGVDLNLQYPAGWENARSIKAALGISGPGPRDYPGTSPLSEPESRAVYTLTLAHDFQLTLSFHTQGKVIYWKYLDYEPKNSYNIAEKFGALSGYAVEETPDVSGYAGYKDWFISAYNRPGYTIEAGEGTSPLPLSQFKEIYDDCLGILTNGLTTDSL